MTASQSDVDRSAEESSRPIVPIFDGHNDTLLRLHLAGGDVAPFLNGRRGHIDLAKARAGGLVGGFFAVFVPNEHDDLLDTLAGSSTDTTTAKTQQHKTSETAGGSASTPDRTETNKQGRARAKWSRDHVPYSPPVAVDDAIRVADAVVNLLHRLIDASEGRVQLLTDTSMVDQVVEDLRADPKPGRDVSPSDDESALSAVLHFEGAEPIKSDLSNLEYWYERGLRSLGLVWSRRNAFAAGIPFRFPSTPDHFEGLSLAGFDLVRACDELGIVIDLAHLNEAGFWDVQRTSRKPLVATHMGVLSICPSSRNLTDDQIRAVGDSDGVIGINLHCGDIRPDGRLNSDTPLEVVLQHVEAVVDLVGIRHVALGSDFDGALMPQSLADASRLQSLVTLLVDRRWDPEDIAAFCFGNWLRALRTAWS